MRLYTAAAISLLPGANGSYTDELRAKGIEFDPENMAMTGFFDEPPGLEGER